MYQTSLFVPERDPQRVQRLTAATMLAVVAVFTLLATAWTRERLQIERVTAPKPPPFELSSMALLPTQRPEPPAAPEDPTSGDATASPTAPTTPRAANLEAGPPESGASASATGTTSATDENLPALDQGGGCPGGVCTASTRTGPPQRPVTPEPCPDCKGPDQAPPASRSAPRTVDFSTLDCLSCPDPDRAALRQTTAGTVRVRFCVDARGRIEPASLRVGPSFGDEEVDAIVRRAVQRWRFEPLRVAGQARRSCSETRFAIRFQ